MSNFVRNLAALPDAHLIAEMQPDPDGDRDYPGPQVCPCCNADLELNADFRCVRCGNG